MGRLVPLLLLTLASATAASGSDAPSAPAPPVFASDVEFVHLVVAAEDRQGRPVIDLRKEDWVVEENGRAQQLELSVNGTEAGRDPRLDVDLALLLDVSSTMLPNVKLSRTAAVRFLDGVARSRTMLMVLFNQEVRGFRYTRADRDASLELIDRTEPKGGTALYDAIQVALGQVRGGSGRQVIVVVSDGVNESSRLNFAGLMRRIRSSFATIYSVAFPIAVPEAPDRVQRARDEFERVARVTGGLAFKAKDAAAISQVYDRILSDLSSQYVLGYAPAHPERDQRFRRLRIRVRRPGVKLRYREGYVAPGREPSGP